jgi:cytoplasmic iron level regulating protein YaaA (DUF328/UPF0246 family)
VTTTTGRRSARARTFVLLPPSEGKADGGTGTFDPAGGTFDLLGPSRREVIEQLAKEVSTRDEEGRTKILGVRGALADRAAAATDALAAGTVPALAARRRYTGVVWEHLDAGTLTRSQAARVLVPSALLGITTGADPVPDYRLKFTVALAGLGRLDRFWRDELTDALAEHVAGRCVVDLLPAEHAAAIDWDRLGAACDLRRVRFVTADGRAGAGHAAKAAKGRWARAVLDEGVTVLDRGTIAGWRVTSPKGSPTVTITAPRG